MVESQKHVQSTDLMLTRMACDSFSCLYIAVLADYACLGLHYIDQWCICVFVEHRTPASPTA